jgi:hypothetical protein
LQPLFVPHRTLYGKNKTDEAAKVGSPSLLENKNNQFIGPQYKKKR